MPVYATRHSPLQVGLWYPLSKEGEEDAGDFLDTLSAIGMQLWGGCH
jgi:hypothetical protein